MAAGGDRGSPEGFAGIGDDDARQRGGAARVEAGSREKEARFV